MHGKSWGGGVPENQGTVISVVIGGPDRPT